MPMQAETQTGPATRRLRWLDLNDKFQLPARLPRSHVATSVPEAGRRLCEQFAMIGLRFRAFFRIYPVLFGFAAGAGWR
ncbi:MAG: hypothetical protein B6D36_01405 [Planctomycetes bacterium UTPLA1]|nr:MAG: hypothetical protein B6D36_01405 [Planctomycetes bacterium UTPLA1]